MGTFNPKIVVFACENSGIKALEEAETRGLGTFKNVTVIPFHCGGRMDSLYMLKAFERGADAVVVLICHKDNCRYLEGNLHAENRAAETKRLLESIGIEPERLVVRNVSAVEAVKTSEIIGETMKALAGFGPALVNES